MKARNQGGRARKLEGDANEERDGNPFADGVRLLDRSSSADYLPLLDVTECGDFVYVTLETPGVTADQVRVWVRGSCIRVAGEKPADFPAGKVSFLRLERGFGKFCRTFEVIGPVDLGKVSARQKDGILTITIPKIPERRGRERLVPVMPD